jgi:hypothetical protein
LASTLPELQIVVPLGALTPNGAAVSTGATNLTDLPAPPLVTSSQNSTAVPSALDQAQVLVNGVVALQIQFLTPTATLQSTFQFNYSNPTATTNTPTVIVSMIVLDNAAYQLAASANAFGNLSTDLANGSGPTGTQTYAQYWNAQISSPTFGANLPKPVRAGLRVFERRIAIPVPLTIID